MTENIKAAKKYAKIDYNTRERLLDLILVKKLSFREASDLLKINQSTARMIVRKYKREGKLF